MLGRGGVKPDLIISFLFTLCPSEHSSCHHCHSEDRGRSLRQVVEGRPWCQPEHHPRLYWCRQSCRQGHPWAQRVGAKNTILLLQYSVIAWTGVAINPVSLVWHLPAECLYFIASWPAWPSVSPPPTCRWLTWQSAWRNPWVTRTRSIHNI